MGLSFIVPKKFLCKYPLRTGAFVVGVFMCCLMGACIIGTLVQILSMATCHNSCSYLWRNCYGLVISATVYCDIILFVNICFLWGIKNDKSSVVLSWVVITAMWLVQTMCILIVLLCMYYSETTFAGWLMSFICGIVALGILVYCLLVGYGYWLELKGTIHVTGTTP